MMPRSSHLVHGARIAAWFLLASSAGCSSRTTGGKLNARRVSLTHAPVDDPPGRCHDIGSFRVCFSARCPEGVCVTPRPLPAELAAISLAVRCTGFGAERSCRPRAELASPFHCRAQRCVQDLPRLPDDGEWECADLAGIVLCRGGAQPAGVAATHADPGWLCGQRKNQASSERICADLDPDLPSSDESARSCRFEISGARLRRICEARGSPRFGDPCSRDQVCPQAGLCLGGVCLPPRIEPNCWSDFDCGAGRCVYGTCGAAPT